MKVNRDLEITAEEFFDGLFQEIVDDITKNSSKSVSKNDIKKGFKFVYRGDQESVMRVTFEVIDYQENHYYKSKRSSVNGNVTVIYTVNPTDKGINVEFEQILPNENQKQGKLMKAYTELIYLGRMTDHLYNIQKKILFKKEGREEVKPLRLFSPKPKK